MSYKTPYKKAVQVPTMPGVDPAMVGQMMTTVVVDQVDFDKMCDLLVGVFDVRLGDRASAGDLEMLREAKYLPFCRRGTKTQCVFDLFDVETDFLSVIVRGMGPEVYRRTFGSLVLDIEYSEED